MKLLVTVVLALVSVPVLAADQPSVHVKPVNLQGPRQLQSQTASAVVRDYLQSWQSLHDALNQNQSTLLDPFFVGTARDKLAATIQQQRTLGFRTSYNDLSHDIQIVFYSPEGLSIQLIDNVEYDEEVFDHDKLLTKQRVHGRYIAILTPAEARWRVRLFQGAPQ